MNQTIKALAAKRASANTNETGVTFPVMLEKFKAEIARALPRHLNADRMARIALTEFRKNPKLQECEPRSIFAAVIQASQLGLEIGLMGEAHLVPFDGQCQLVPGYTGLMKLARQSGLVQDIYAHAVRANDKFTLKLGLERDLQHEPLSGPGGFPASDEERGEITGFYAVAVFKDGSRTFQALGRKEVEAVRDDSRGYQAAKRLKKESVWDTDFEAMGLKTAIRRLCKFLPKSPELATALAMDAAFERGRPQNLDMAAVIEGSYVSVEEDDGPPRTDQLPQSPAPANAVEQAPGAASATRTRLQQAMRELREATTIEALDEAYVRAEPELSGVELEALMREYRALKSKITGR